MISVSRTDYQDGTHDGDGDAGGGDGDDGDVHKYHRGLWAVSCRLCMHGLCVVIVL